MGAPELIIILLLVVVLFGASKIPQLGKGLGEGIRNFKQGLKSGDDQSIIPPNRQLPDGTDATKPRST